jgi:1-deoxy-D-xylulose-5-phosphate reductoisomerase
MLNAANEVAVAAFLERRIRFDQIYVVNESCMNRISSPEPNELGDLLALDAQTRLIATQIVCSLAQ